LNGFLLFNYKDVAPPGLELHAFRRLPHCRIWRGKVGVAGRRQKKDRLAFWP
jgi:hypothetical protein